MLTITFKDVGQGDSIVIEWSGENKNYIGIIDCNKKGNKNPVLEHLKSAKYKIIDFIILSHPHYDHFSGFEELLNYCEAQNILIKRFMLTAQTTYANFLACSQKSLDVAKTQISLTRLLKKVKNLQHHIIKKKSYINNEIKEYPLNSNIFLKILSPSSEEFDKFAKEEINTIHDEEPGNNPNGNYLSSFIKIYSCTDDWYIILTADSPQSIFKRLGINESQEFDKTMLLAQYPHHGSEKSYYNSFWRTKRKIHNVTTIAYSVGANNIHGHPNIEIANKLKRKHYITDFTYTHDLLRQNKLKSRAKKKHIALNLISKPIDIPVTNGDLVYKIKKNTIEKQNE